MDLTSIPNNVSGDGRVFVKQLKKYLGVVIDDITNGDLFAPTDETDTSSYCQPLSFVNLTQTQQAGINSIKVSWDKSSVYGFKEATVFYRNITSSSFTVAGTSESNEYVIEDVSVGRYGVKVVPSNIDGGYDKNPKEFFIDVVSSMTTPEPPQQFVVTFDSGEGHWSWKYEGVYDYFELRTDTNVGVTSEFLLARTADKYVVKEPNVSHGTAYLYVRNSFGVYSAPATHGFDIADLGIPPKPTLAKGYNGVNIHMEDKGDNDYYVIQVEETVYDNVVDNPFYIERTRGAMRVRYCHKKDGVNKAWSNWAIFNISTLVGTEDIANGAVTVDKISVGEGAFAKIFAGNIDLTGNLAIVGGAVTLNENGLTCTQTNGSFTLFNEAGITFFDNSGFPYSAIHRMCIGSVEHGKTVKFAKPWDDIPQILVMPTSIQVNNSETAQSNVFLECRAENITVNGFKAICRTILGGGSVGIIPINKTGSFRGWGYTTVTVNLGSVPNTKHIGIRGTLNGGIWRKDGGGGGAAISVTLKFKANGNVVSTYTRDFSAGMAPSSPPSSWGAGDGVCYWSSLITFDREMDIPQGATITVDVIVPRNGDYRAYTAEYNFQEFTYLTANPTVISTGSVNFIAIENANSGYSVVEV